MDLGVRGHNLYPMEIMWPNPHIWQLWNGTPRLHNWLHQMQPHKALHNFQRTCKSKGNTQPRSICKWRAILMTKYLIFESNVSWSSTKLQQSLDRTAITSVWRIRRTPLDLRDHKRHHLLYYLNQGLLDVFGICLDCDVASSISSNFVHVSNWVVSLCLSLCRRRLYWLFSGRGALNFNLPLSVLLKGS